MDPIGISDEEQDFLQRIFFLTSPAFSSLLFILAENRRVYPNRHKSTESQRVALLNSLD